MQGLSAAEEAALNAIRRSQPGGRQIAAALEKDRPMLFTARAGTPLRERLSDAMPLINTRLKTEGAVAGGLDLEASGHVLTAIAWGFPEWAAMEPIWEESMLEESVRKELPLLLLSSQCSVQQQQEPAIRSLLRKLQKQAEDSRMWLGTAVKDPREVPEDASAWLDRLEAIECQGKKDSQGWSEVHTVSPTPQRRMLAPRSHPTDQSVDYGEYKTNDEILSTTDHHSPDDSSHQLPGDSVVEDAEKAPMRHLIALHAWQGRTAPLHGYHPWLMVEDEWSSLSREWSRLNKHKEAQSAREAAGFLEAHLHLEGIRAAPGELEAALSNLPAGNRGYTCEASAAMIAWAPAMPAGAEGMGRLLWIRSARKGTRIEQSLSRLEACRS